MKENMLERDSPRLSTTNLQCLWTESGISCEKMFQNLIKLMDHISDDHISNMDKFMCSWKECNRTGDMFSNTPKLLMHIGTHLGVGSFKCKNCDRRLVTSSSLKAYEKIIGGGTVYRFICPDCWKLTVTNLRNGRSNQSHVSCEAARHLSIDQTLDYNNSLDCLDQVSDIRPNQEQHYCPEDFQEATGQPRPNTFEECCFKQDPGSFILTSGSTANGYARPEHCLNYSVEFEKDVVHEEPGSVRNLLHHQSSSSSITSINWSAQQPELCEKNARALYPQLELHMEEPSSPNGDSDFEEQESSSIDSSPTEPSVPHWQCSWNMDGVECTEIIENSAHLLKHINEVHHRLSDSLEEIPEKQESMENGSGHRSSMGTNGIIEHGDDGQLDQTLDFEQDCSQAESNLSTQMEVSKPSEPLLSFVRTAPAAESLGSDLREDHFFQLLQNSEEATHKTMEQPVVPLTETFNQGQPIRLRFQLCSSTSDAIGSTIDKEAAIPNLVIIEDKSFDLPGTSHQLAPAVVNQNQPPKTTTPFSTPSLSPTYSEPSFPIATHDVQCQWQQSAEVCMRIFQGPAELRKHIFTEHRLDPRHFVCYWKDCDRDLRPFTANIYLVEHLRKHTGERPFRCKYCSRAFTTANSVRDHERIHLDLRCPHDGCTARFRQMRGLKDHLWSHKPLCDLTPRPKSPDSPPPSIPCMWRTKGQYCTETFQEPRDLTAHITAAHLPNSRSLVCRWKGCKLRGKRKTNRNEFLDHIRSHYGDKEHRCRICGNEFLRASALKKHMKNLHPVEFAEEIALKVSEQAGGANGPDPGVCRI